MSEGPRPGEHPRGTLAITAVLAVVYVAVYFAVYVLIYVPRGAVTP